MEGLRHAGDPWQQVKLIDELKVKARAADLCNIFMAHEYEGLGGISDLDYAPLCEVMGRVIDHARLMTLNATNIMDVAGNKAARAEIAMIKLIAPNISCKVIDWAIRAHGAAGISGYSSLAETYAHQRTVRIVAGPDEVHRNAIAKIVPAKRTAARSNTAHS